MSESDTCNYCEKVLDIPDWKDKKFCSRECHNKSMSKKVERTCENCGEEYRTKSSRRKKYCSHDCYVNHTSKEKIQKTCDNCGDDFEVLPSNKDKRFCSRDCYREAEFVQDYPELECKHCGDKYEVHPLREEESKYCSHECYVDHRVEKDDFTPPEHTEEVRRKISEANSGENHYNWKGGTFEAECNQCSDNFDARLYRKDHSDRIFCSRKCWREWKSKNYELEDTPVGKAGDQHHNWAGGGEYPPEWTIELKDQIRDRDDRECQECGLDQPECIALYGIKLPVHHLDGDKQNCSKSNLTSLCPSCHARQHGVLEP